VMPIFSTNVRLLGIHHITALANDPQANLDFYVGVLGLRLVKVSVNQDDPGVYHFFYADNKGSPGTDLTFFPYTGLPRGSIGYGVSTRVYFSIPIDSLDYWLERLRKPGVRVSDPRRDEDGVVIEFEDPDGLPLALVAHREADDKPVDPWRDSPVPSEHFLRGFHKAEITVISCRHSGWFLEEVLGFRRVREDLHRVRYETGNGGSGSMIEVLCPPGLGYGYVGVGSVHHIAWNAAAEEEQAVFRERLQRLGFRVTPVIDRKWFKSIYFREPGHVLYEIATSGPGFGIDEPPERLGSDLVLPEWLEPQRGWIEDRLPRVRLPSGVELPRRRG
jgi:glyoxalase family protein